MKIDKQSFRKSFVFSLLYVGLGTFSLLGLYPSSPFYFEWSILGLLITIPVRFLGFGVAYMESSNYILLLLVQFSVFLLTLFFVYSFLKRKQKR